MRELAKACEENIKTAAAVKKAKLFCMFVIKFFMFGLI